MLTYKIDPITSNGVVAIGGKDFSPKGIETSICSWNDDEGQLHPKKMNNVLYFTDLPGNIMSAKELAESMKDNDIIWLLTKTKYSILNWDFGKFKKKIS